MQADSRQNQHYTEGSFHDFFPLCSFLLLRIEIVHRSSNAHKARHFLQIEGNSPYLHISLLPDFGNDFFLCKRTLLLQDPFDDIRNGARFVAPFLQRIESASNEYKLRITNKFVMNRLNRDILVVEMSLFDLIRDIHKVEGPSLLLQNNFHLVTNASWADKSPFRQSPSILNLLQATINC